MPAFSCKSCAAYLVQDDSCRASSASTLAIEGANGSYDRISTSVSYTLAADASIEVLTTTLNAGTAAINLTGTEVPSA